MKKLALIAVSFLIGNSLLAQQFMTRTGEVKFEATMPGIEEIAGTNKTSSCIFNEGTGDFAALVLVKGFKFKSPLMEEHFNENYMETNKFPKSTFKGKVLNFDAKKLSATKTEFDIEGDLMIHGVTKKVKTKGTFTLVSGKVFVTTAFDVKPQDYAIEIPSLVKDKIAKNAKVTLNFTLEEKK
jgi:hypothetical protein